MFAWESSRVLSVLVGLFGYFGFVLPLEDLRCRLFNIAKFPLVYGSILGCPEPQVPWNRIQAHVTLHRSYPTTQILPVRWVYCQALYLYKPPAMRCCKAAKLVLHKVTGTFDWKPAQTRRLCSLDSHEWVWNHLVPNVQSSNSKTRPCTSEILGKESKLFMWVDHLHERYRIINKVVTDSKIRIPINQGIVS